MISKSDAGGEAVDFDPGALRINPIFIETLEEFMNDEATRAPELADLAHAESSGSLEIIDARYRPHDDANDPPEAEVVGGFAIDETGTIVPGSFQYNPAHLLFHPETGALGLFASRRFYDWVHGLAGAK